MVIFGRASAEKRRAGAIVEFAVVLPLLTTLLFGIIEYGYVFMVRQTMQNAAREGCRVAVLSTSIDPYTNVTDRVDDLMSVTGLTTYSVNMEHATEEEPMETVRVSIAYADVSLTGGFFLSGDNTLTTSCSMRKEGAGGD